MSSSQPAKLAAEPKAILGDRLVSVVLLDAFCPHCDDVLPHAVGSDPTACTCTRCGAAQVLSVPAV